MIRIRRTSVLLALTLSAAALAAAAPAAFAAPVKHPVTIEVNTTFDPNDTDSFSSSIPGCVSGGVEDTAGPGPKFTPWGGVFSGTKSFTCYDEAGGFDLRLQAVFGETGSSGHWVVTDSWGSLEGLTGSGRLVGQPTEAGIADKYMGTLR